MKSKNWLAGRGGEGVPGEPQDYLQPVPRHPASG